MRLIVGSQVTVEDESTIILLAQDRRGYANLCRLLTAGRLRSEKGESAVTWDEIYHHAEGLIALWGGDQSLIVGEVEPNEVAGNLRDAFGDRLYGMITRHRREDEVVQESAIARESEALWISACRGERSSLSHAGPPAAAGCIDRHSLWYSRGLLRPEAQGQCRAFSPLTLYFCPTFCRRSGGHRSHAGDCRPLRFFFG